MKTSRRRFRFHCLAFLLTSVLLLTGTRTLVAQNPNHSECNAQVIVTVSVDWEGFPLDDQNLEAIEKFREEFPAVPLTHFLNAANYCRVETAESVTRKIRRAVRQNDETGVHIHCWRSLVEASGVAFRNRPNFWYDGIPLRKYSFGDAGHEVELAAYDAGEVAKLATKSVELLKQNGFAVSKSFRAAGWVASQNVLEGVREAGFELDSSATDRIWTNDELAKFNIYARLGEVWPQVNQHTQPFNITTAAGELLEMPNTAAMADYVSADEMDLHLKDVLSKAQAGEVRFVHFGFNFETSAQFITRVAQTLAKWEGSQQIRFMTLEQAAQEYRRQTHDNQQ